MAHATSLPPLSSGRKLGEKFEILGVLGEGGTGIVYDARPRRRGRPRRAQGHPPAPGGRRADPRALHARGDHPAAARGRPPLPHPRVRRDPRSASRGRGPALHGAAAGRRPRPRRRPEERGPAAHRARAPHPARRAARRCARRTRRASSTATSSQATCCYARATAPWSSTSAWRRSSPAAAPARPRSPSTTWSSARPSTWPPSRRAATSSTRAATSTPPGIMLYEMLTGRVPFSGGTPLSVLTAHLTSEPQKPRERAPRARHLPGARGRHAPRDREGPGRSATPRPRRWRRPSQAALASPDDVEAVRPASRVHVQIDTSDAHGATIPSPVRIEVAPARPACPREQPAPRPPRARPAPDGSPSASWPPSPASRWGRGCRCAEVTSLHAPPPTPSLPRGSGLGAPNLPHPRSPYKDRM